MKRCEVMVNLSLVYLLAATLFENNNVFYICIYIYYMFGAFISTCAMFANLSANICNEICIIGKFGSLSKKCMRRTEFVRCIGKNID